MPTTVKKKRRDARHHWPTLPQTLATAQEITRAFEALYPQQREQRERRERQRAAQARRSRAEYCSFVRESAANGHYVKKPCSKFSEKFGNLPLDLWDSTPDP